MPHAVPYPHPKVHIPNLGLHPLQLDRNCTMASNGDAVYLTTNITIPRKTIAPRGTRMYAQVCFPSISGEVVDVVRVVGAVDVAWKVASILVEAPDSL